MPPNIATPPSPSLDPATHALIRIKSRQIAARYWLQPSDREDVEQDLAAHVWPRLGRHDPARADREVFVRMLVARAAATVVRRRLRRRVTDPLATARLVGGADHVDPRAWPGPEAGVDRALDVDAVLAAAPRRLRRTAALVAIGSVASAARRLGLTRQAVYARLTELGGYFEAAGLGPSGGPGKSSDTPRAAGVVTGLGGEPPAAGDPA